MKIILLLVLILHGYTLDSISITAVESRTQANSFWVRQNYGPNAAVYSVADMDWDSWEQPDLGTYIVTLEHVDHETTWTMQAPSRSHTYTIYSKTTCDKIYWQKPEFCP